MKNTIKTLLLLALITFCATSHAQSAQATAKATALIYKYLQEGDCEKAQEKYEDLKIAIKERIPDIEESIKDWKKMPAIVQLTNMNILYVGVENPVSIYVPGLSNEDFTVAISSGTITPVWDGIYNVMISELEPVVTITVYAKDDNKPKPIGEYTYITRKIPSPVLKVGNLSSKKVTKDELSNAGIIKAVFPEDFVFNIPPLNVKGYTISVGANDKPIWGNIINAEAQSIIRQARKGQRVMISDVQVVLPDGRIETLETAFRIK